MKLSQSMFALCMLAGLGAGSSAWADCTTPVTHAVTNPSDDGSPGTLRFLVNSASVQDCDTIEIPATTIVLDGATGNIPIDKNITIRGAGADQTIIDANGPVSGDMAFLVDTLAVGTGVTFEGLTVQNAASTGAIVAVGEGNLQIIDSTIRGNATAGVVVAGVANSLVVQGSRIVDNVSTTAGGILLAGAGVTGVISDSEISNNQTTSAGGGIQAASVSLEILNSKINDNTAAAAAGGIYSASGTLSVIGSEISGNTATNGGAGGLYLASDSAIISDSSVDNNVALNNQPAAGILIASSPVHVLRSSVSGNHAEAQGGGIYNAGFLTVEDSTIADNIADSDSTGNGGGGGFFNASSLVLSGALVDGNTTNSQFGGGVFSATFLTVSDSVISNNTAVASDAGGLFLTGLPVVVQNSTISGNRATGASSVFGGQDAVAGGILSQAISVDFINCTLANNEADGHGGGLVNLNSASFNNSTITGNVADANEGGLNGGDGGGFYHVSSQRTVLNNSILAGNRDASAGAEAPDCVNSSILGGIVTLGSANLIQNLNGCDVQGMVDHLVEADPLFDTAGLADNEGRPVGFPDSAAFVQTVALQSGSPAIDASDAGCAPVDARGVERPIDGDGDGEAKCDLGAFEASVAAGTTGGDTTGGDTTGGDTTGGDTGGDSGGGCSLVR